jgi:exodeoxyribonuclease VII small subunit
MNSSSDRLIDTSNPGVLDQHLRLQHWNYEATVAEIEAVIVRIESGELELAEVFSQFEAAVSQLRQCEVFLSERQQQMDLLVETLTDLPKS